MYDDVGGGRRDNWQRAVLRALLPHVTDVIAVPTLQQRLLALLRVIKYEIRAVTPEVRGVSALPALEWRHRLLIVGLVSMVFAANNRAVALEVRGALADLATKRLQRGLIFAGITVITTVPGRAGKCVARHGHRDDETIKDSETNCLNLYALLKLTNYHHIMISSALSRSRNDAHNTRRTTTAAAEQRTFMDSYG